MVKYPEDWKVVRFGEVWEHFSTGPFGSALHASDYIVGGTPIVNPIHIVAGRIVPDAETTVSDSTVQRLCGYKLSVGDLVMGRRGEMGRVAVVGYKESGWLCGTGCFFIKLKSFADPGYVSLHLRTPECVKAFEDEAVGTTIPNLNQAVAGRINVVVPPLPEQKRIAAALGNVDKLIDNLSRQIEKKRLVKQGVMQDLLTGKKRLPGFKGEWVEKKLGEIGAWLKGQALAKSELASHGRKACVHYGELFTTYGAVIRSVVSRTDSDAKVLSKAGDILFPISDVTPEGLGRCSSILDDNVILGGDILALRPLIDVDSAMLSNVINLHKRKIIEQVTGTTVRHVSSTNLSKIVVVIPPALAEQKAIAKVLGDMDAEIVKLEAKHEKYCQLKQGLMNDLLTGKVRI